MPFNLHERLPFILSTILNFIERLCAIRVAAFLDCRRIKNRVFTPFPRKDGQRERQAPDLKKRKNRINPLFTNRGVLIAEVVAITISLLKTSLR